MNKMKTRSGSHADHIGPLEEVVLSCVTGTRDEATGGTRISIDVDRLKQALSDKVVEGEEERFRLDWPGKREAAAFAGAPIFKTLRPCREESVDFDTTQNLFLEGDNLEALKIIEEAFLGKVKLIYIDPPYNTGRNLIYKNDYSQKTKDYLKITKRTDVKGRKSPSNPEIDGRFHAGWLSMIYQRLKIAKNFLAKDGVLVCAIDENEFGTLSVLMEEIFPRFSWEHHYICAVNNPRGQQGRNFSYVHEYLIFVCPAGTKSIGNRRIHPEDVKWSNFGNWGGGSNRSDAKNYFYPVLVRNGDISGFGDECPDHVHPAQTEWKGETAHVYPIDNSGVEGTWLHARQSVDDIAAMLRAKRSKDGYQIQIGNIHEPFRTVWNNKRYDSNEYGTKLINTLVAGSGFTFPKSLWAVYDPVDAVTRDDKNAIVLDFFAGSATTAHAVMRLNADDGGNRRFIMVQVPEAIDAKSPPFKRGFTNIAEISKERIRRAGLSILDGQCHPAWNRDIGFRALKVDTSNMKDSYYHPPDPKQYDLLDIAENVKSGRTSEDLLFQSMVDLGVDPALPIKRETVRRNTVFFVGGDAIAACFDRNLTEKLVEEVADRGPRRAVFRGCGFSDAGWTNVERIFRHISPATEVWTI